MSLQKSKNRERKYNKKRYGMRVDNKAIFLIQRIQKKRAEEIKRKREKNDEKENNIQK